MVLPNTFTYAEAQRAGVSDRNLRKLLLEAEVLRLGRGVYARNIPFLEEELVEIAARAPDATLCLLTALSRHALSDQIPTRIDVALPRHRRPPRLTTVVAWHRFDASTYDIGRTSLDLGNDLHIGIYSPERCIVDAFRLRHQEGEEVAIEALRRWLRRSTSTPAILLEMASHFPKAKPSLLHALRILL
jgi:predicted transcriptional regulator of viral defense system